MAAVSADSDEAVVRPHRPRGRPGHGRDEVLQHAVELFNRQGYEATSISGLAKSLGITKSGIFHHFESKESMLAAALDEALDGLARAVETGGEHAGGGQAYDRLRATVHASVEILVAHQPAVTLLLRIRGNSPLERQALQRRRAIDDQLAALVADAAAEGKLRADIEPHVISRLIFGMVNSLTEWYRTDGAIDAHVIASDVTNVLFDGLAAD